MRGARRRRTCDGRGTGLQDRGARPGVAFEDDGVGVEAVLRRRGMVLLTSADPEMKMQSIQGGTAGGVSNALEDVGVPEDVEFRSVGGMAAGASVKY